MATIASGASRPRDSRGPQLDPPKGANHSASVNVNAMTVNNQTAAIARSRPLAVHATHNIAPGTMRNKGQNHATPPFGATNREMKYLTIVVAEWIRYCGTP